MPLDLGGTTIVFDLDGTLVDTAPDLTAATNHTLSLKGLAPMTVAELHPFIGHGSFVMIEAGLRFRGMSVGRDEIERLHEHFLAFYADNIAVGSRPFEGIRELLDHLLASGARLGVCTNKLEGLSKELLQALGLATRFAAIAGGDTFTVRKPAARHLTGTIEMAGGQPGPRGDGGRQRGRFRRGQDGRRSRHRGNLRLHAAAGARAGRRARRWRRNRSLSRIHARARANLGSAATRAQTSRDSLSLAAPKVISWPVSSSGTGPLPSTSPSRRVPLVEPRSRKLRPCSGS